MDITVSYEQGRIPVTVFHVKGDIDNSSFEQLQRQAQDAFKAGTRNILLDLTEVPYTSSAGIRALHSIFTLLRTDSPDESDEVMGKGLRDGTFRSPHLKLLNPSNHVLKALTTAGVDMFLEIHHNPKNALASF